MSVYMVAIWLLCFVPLSIILIVSAEMLATSGEDGGITPVTPQNFVLVGIQSFVDLLVIMISSVAMAKAINSFYVDDRKRSDF